MEHTLTALTNLRDERFFPAFSGLSDENDIDLDFYTSKNGYLWNPSKHWCFLAEIVNFNALIRLRLYVRDKTGNTVQIAFHTDARGEEVPLSLVESGNTVAILYAQQHSFMDFTTGIRLEDMPTFKDCQTTGWREKGHKDDCKVLQDRDLQAMFRMRWDHFDEFKSFPLN
ncbi:hypothetical protein AAE478_005111 [Parahypoxylon ruwenzoriense]